MKSKSFELKRSSSEKVQNKTFDFTSYYKSAAETRSAIENPKSTTENINKDIKFSKAKNGTPGKRERSPNKKKNKLEPLDISHIDIEGPSLNTSIAKSTPLKESKLTSTPQALAKGSQAKVKSIMKNTSSHSDDHSDTPVYSAPSKPKKRNKSVSFMLDDTEELVIKKTKSNESITRKPDTSKKQSPKETNKIKKKKLTNDVKGKENQRNDNVNLETEAIGKGKKTERLTVKDVKSDSINGTPIDSTVTKEENNINKKSKFKKFNKQNSIEVEESLNESNNNEDQTENRNRKSKKKKHSAKSQQNTEGVEGDGEPAAKAQKKEVKPEAIVENLENLSIGDNAHTLTNLLDDMTVVDKDKKKKNRQKRKKEKKPPTNIASSEAGDLEKTEEVKEKIKWKKRKWNKDKKAEADEDGMNTSVIIDNLPLSIICSYKKQLTDQFGKHGLIKKIGVAEVYPAEESKPVFTTSIQFLSEAAAEQALEEDRSEVCGSVIRVRLPLPAPQTTLVVRSYAELTDQSVSSAFAQAGKIRNIRHLVKGKKSIATAFVEFDGEEALRRALALAAARRVAGKKLHAARFELRRKRRPRDADSEGSDD